jgi:hypothetical protein
MVISHNALLLAASFYCTNHSEFQVLTCNTPRMIVSVTKIAEVMWCFGTNSNGNLPTLVITITVIRVIMKCDLSQATYMEMGDVGVRGRG